MKISFKLIYWLLLFCVSFAQAQLPDLIPYRVGKKWGYCDQTKKIIINAVYDEVRLFAGDKAAVRSGIYWGYINKKGSVIIPIKYYLASDFYGENYDEAKVSELIKTTPKTKIKKEMNKECGTLDAALQNTDLAFEYRDMLVKSSPCVTEYIFLIDGKGKLKERLDYEMKYLDGQKRNYSTIIKGREFVQVEHIVNVTENKKGYDVFRAAGDNLVSVKKNGKWGYADTAGTIKVELKYDYTGDFSEGIALAQSGEKFIGINKSGEELFTYDNGILIGEFHNGLILAKNINKNEPSYKSDKFGYVNAKGEYEIKPIFKNATSFYSGYAVVKDSMNKFHYMDTKDNFVPTEPNWEIPVECCTEYLGPVENLVQSNGLFKVKRKYSKKAEDIKETANFQYDERVGFINKEGKSVAACEYDSTGRFVNGVCKVVIDRKAGLINESGKRIAEVKYDELNMPRPFGCFYNNYSYKTILDYYQPNDLLKQGLIRVIVNDKVGLIDVNGTEYFEEAQVK